jgi:hypothetical protein
MKDVADRQGTRHLATLGEILDKPLIYSFLLTNDPEIRQFEDGITALNVAYFFGTISISAFLFIQYEILYNLNFHTSFFSDLFIFLHRRLIFKNINPDSMRKRIKLINTTDGRKCV